jgi:phage-related protein
VLETKFGDGYRQRAADGINNVEQSWSLTWEHLTETEKETIEAFLLARGGWESFDWTPPGAASASRWTCPKWGFTDTGAAYWTCTATFRKEFDL